MKKLFVLGLLAICTSISGQITDTIEWRESYKLCWSDFKSSPDAASPYGAATGASILYDFKNNQDAMTCIVKVYFERQRSWVKDKDKQVNTLKHEQGHFDLYEIYARKIRKALSEKTFHVKSLESDFKKIVKKVLKKADAQQKKYDKTTKHGLKESNQNAWLNNIAEELKSLDQYKNPAVVLSIK